MLFYLLYHRLFLIRKWPILLSRILLVCTGVLIIVIRKCAKMRKGRSIFPSHSPFHHVSLLSLSASLTHLDERQEGRQRGRKTWERKRTCNAEKRLITNRASRPWSLGLKLVLYINSHSSAPPAAVAVHLLGSCETRVFRDTCQQKSVSSAHQLFGSESLKILNDLFVHHD